MGKYLSCLKFRRVRPGDVEVDEVYHADLERKRQRLWEEEAEREIGRLTRHNNFLRDSLTREVMKNAELREDLDELREVKSALTEERRLRAEKEEICAKLEVDLEKHRKEIDQQKTCIALLRAHVGCSECKRSEFQQIDDSNWVKELVPRDKEVAAIKRSIAQLKEQIAAMEIPTSRLQHQVKSALTEERRLRAEKEEICANLEVDLEKHRKEINQQKTCIALLRAHVGCSECKRSEFQQIDDSNWVKELEPRDKEVAAIKRSIAQLKEQIAAMESPTSRLQHQSSNTRGSLFQLQPARPASGSDSTDCSFSETHQSHSQVERE